MLDRWEALRHYHRQYILANPGCIGVDESITDLDPEMQASRRATKQRLDRQLWLSRLLVATPRILAAAEYARIRRQIELVDGALSTPRNSRGARQRGEQLQLRTAQMDMANGAAAQGMSAEPVVPLGYVAGATAQQQPAPVQIMDHKTSADVLRERGQQRLKNADVQDGFEDL